MDQNLSRLTKVGNWIATLLLGNTRELIARIDERTIIIQKDVDVLKSDFKEMRSKVDDMSPKLDILWKDKLASAHSRRELNTYGKKVLEESGIKEIINERKIELLNLVKAKGSKNIYDAEQDILSVVKRLPERYPNIVDALKTGAFNTGADMDTVLFAGGIYLRDLILQDLGFPA
jgi:hypothetical protein